jgi:hypothetical protein
MGRGRVSAGSEAGSEQLQRALREREELSRTIEQLKLQFTASLQESHEQQRRVEADKSLLVQRLEQQLAQQRSATEAALG